MITLRHEMKNAGQNPILREKNGGDCYSKTEQTVTVLMAQN